MTSSDTRVATNATKESMSSIILSPLNELQSLSQTLFLSLSPAQTKPPPPPPLSSFLNCDKALSSAIALANTHQIRQRRIEALKDEILALDARWREICMELETGKRELEGMIKEGEERITAIDDAGKGLSETHICPMLFSSLPANSIDTLSGASGLRSESQRVHICSPEYARFKFAWSASTPVVLSPISERREDAPRSSQRRSTAGPSWGDTLCWSWYVSQQTVP